MKSYRQLKDEIVAKGLHDELLAAIERLPEPAATECRELCLDAREVLFHASVEPTCKYVKATLATLSAVVLCRAAIAVGKLSVRPDQRTVGDPEALSTEAAQLTIEYRNLLSKIYQDEQQLIDDGHSGAARPGELHARRVALDRQQSTCLTMAMRITSLRFEAGMIEARRELATFNAQMSEGMTSMLRELVREVGEIPDPQSLEVSSTALGELINYGIDRLPDVIDLGAAEVVGKIPLLGMVIDKAVIEPAVNRVAYQRVKRTVENLLAATIAVHLAMDPDG